MMGTRKCNKCNLSYDNARESSSDGFGTVRAAGYFERCHHDRTVPREARMVDSPRPFLLRDAGEPFG